MNVHLRYLLSALVLTLGWAGWVAGLPGGAAIAALALFFNAPRPQPPSVGSRVQAWLTFTVLFALGVMAAYTFFQSGFDAMRSLMRHPAFVAPAWALMLWLLFVSYRQRTRPAGTED